MKLEEDLYQRLNVDRRAKMAEIVAAYHAARAAFSKDSPAAYSLLDSAHSDEVVRQLEEAYLTLSNSDRRRAYDEQLARSANGGAAPVAEPSPTDAGAVSASVDVEENYGPEGLRRVRELRGLSVKDVSRVTKIPARFLEAIETMRHKDLPARVYLQGFVRNLAAFYRLDPTKTLHGYLRILDADKPPVV